MSVTFLTVLFAISFAAGNINNISDSDNGTLPWNSTGRPAPGHGGHHGIHVASWRWDEIGLFFTFTLFTIITGLAKVAFHHAHFLSAYIPESCLMILLGVSVGLIIFLCGTDVPDNDDDKIFPQENVREFAIPTFTNRLFFMVLLPPVILESAYSLYDRAFAFNFHTVLLYAVIGTLINTFSIGPMLYGLSEAGMVGPIGAGGSYTLSLIDALVFSALISAVDPVAVLAIFQEVGVNKDLYYLVFGESLLNDAVTVVLYTTMETFSKMPAVDPSQYGLAVVAFFTVSLGGCAIGIVFGLITALITRTTEDVRVVEPLAVLGIAYLSYLAAEIFHFSGIISIIFCGIVQAHYSFKNISQKSYVTVKYFTRMVSSTCDAIIFLFLGMVLVNDTHVWHTGFVLWTLLLCFICRFLGVFILTAVANKYRVKPINIQEQFIMAYGGLRGAVAFSLADTLDEFVKPRREFVTTTLIVILFTVFVQGGTIKLLVNLLHIKKSKTGLKSMNEEINDNVIGVLMAGVEEIAGTHSDFYIRRKFEQLDHCFLNKIFLKPGNEGNLKRVFEKLALTEHFAHLYGPEVFKEGEKAPLLPGEEKLSPGPSRMYKRSPSVRTTVRFSSLYPDVEIRKRVSSGGDQEVPSSAQSSTGDSCRSSLRQAFGENPFIKMHKWPSPHTVVTHFDTVKDQLEMRHMRTLRMSEYFLASESGNPFNDITDSVQDDDVFTPEKEHNVPEELHDVYAVLTRAQRRLSRKTSNSSDDSRNSVVNGSPAWPPQLNRENSNRRLQQQPAWRDQKQLHDIEEAEHDMMLSDSSLIRRHSSSSSSSESPV